MKKESNICLFCGIFLSVVLIVSAILCVAGRNAEMLTKNGAERQLSSLKDIDKIVEAGATETIGLLTNQQSLAEAEVLRGLENELSEVARGAAERFEAELNGLVDFVRFFSVTCSVEKLNGDRQQNQTSPESLLLLPPTRPLLYRSVAFRGNRRSGCEQIVNRDNIAAETEQSVTPIPSDQLGPKLPTSLESIEEPVFVPSVLPDFFEMFKAFAEGSNRFRIKGNPLKIVVGEFVERFPEVRGVPDPVVSNDPKPTVTKEEPKKVEAAKTEVTKSEAAKTGGKPATDNSKSPSVVAVAEEIKKESPKAPEPLVAAAPDDRKDLEKRLAEEIKQRKELDSRLKKAIEQQEQFEAAKKTLETRLAMETERLKTAEATNKSLEEKIVREGEERKKSHAELTAELKKVAEASKNLENRLAKTLQDQQAAEERLSKEFEARKAVEAARLELEQIIVAEKKKWVDLTQDKEKEVKIAKDAVADAEKKLHEELERRTVAENAKKTAETKLQQESAQRVAAETKLKQELEQNASGEEKAKQEDEQRQALEMARKTAETDLQQEAAQRKTAETKLKQETESRQVAEEAKKAAEAKLQQESARRVAAETKLKQETESRQVAEEAKKTAEAKLQQESAQRVTAETKLKQETENRQVAEEAKKAVEAKLQQESAQRVAVETKLKQETESRQVAEEAKKAAEAKLQQESVQRVAVETKLKQETENRQVAEEAKKAAETKLQQESAQRVAVETKLKQETENRQVAEEAKKAAEMKLQQESAQRVAVETKLKQETESRQVAEEAKKAAETKLQQESAQRVAVETKLKQETENRQVAEEAKKAAETKLQQESVQRVAAETKLKQETENRQVAEEAKKAAETKLQQESVQNVSVEDKLKQENERRQAVEEEKKTLEARLQQEISQRKSVEEKIELETEARQALEAARKTVEAALQREAAQRKTTDDTLKQEAETRRNVQEKLAQEVITRKKAEELLRVANEKAVKQAEDFERRQKATEEAAKNARNTERREILKDRAYKAVQGNEAIQSAWFCWEPNKFDTSDENNGRFSSRSLRNRQGQVETVDVERPDGSDFYVKPLSSGRTFVSEPTRRNGNESMILISTPIRHRKETLGVCGIDVQADRFRDALAAIVKEHEILKRDGKITLVSPAGNVVASSDPKVDAGSTYRSESEKEFFTVSRTVEINGVKWTVHLSAKKTEMNAVAQKLRDAGQKTRDTVEKHRTIAKDFVTTSEADIPELVAVDKAAARRSMRYLGFALSAAALLLAGAVVHFVRKQSDRKDKHCVEILDAVPVPVFVTDKDSQVLIRNKAAEDRRLEVSTDALKALFQRNRTAGREESDGAVFDIASQRLLDERQQVIGAVQVFADVSYRTETMQSLEEIGRLIAESQQGLRDIAASTDGLGNATSQTLDQLSGISAKVEKSCQLSDSTGENASQANRFTRDAVQAASKGQEQMKGMIDSMKDICEMSARMQKVIKSIDEIAFQTNLLALNAAVEAARAGVHGKGFAVVAEEVRNLATRSAKAARETAELIASSNTQILGGAEIANQTAGALDEITRMIEGATGLVSQIAETSTEQSGVVREISRELAQLEQISQQNVHAGEAATESTRTVLDAARQLQSQCEAMKSA